MTAMKVVPHELLVWAYSKLSALGLQNGSMDSALKMDEIGLILQGAYDTPLSAVEPAPDGLVDADGEFEIIDRHNCRHRFDKKQYRWSWGIEAGTIDRDDHNLVVVFDIPANDDEEGVVVKEFPFASQVGDVGAGESLNLREVPIERCPRCSFAQPAALTSRAAVLEEGCTPVDIRVLREANVDLATENQRLRQALRFYANGDHWICEGKARAVWDTCSGEPQNWFWRENENDDAEGIEDGQIAKMALRGDSIDWEGEEPDAVEGEAEYAIRAAKGE